MDNQHRNVIFRNEIVLRDPVSSLRATRVVAATGLLRPPAAAVEVLIALSIVALAVEARSPRATLVRRRPWRVAFGFGLLHGLGFSSALQEVGLPSGHLLLALLAFNLGVELGKCAFVLVARTVLVAIQRIERRWPAWVYHAPHEVMGAVAAMWCLERITGALAG